MVEHVLCMYVRIYMKRIYIQSNPMPTTSSSMSKMEKVAKRQMKLQRKIRKKKENNISRSPFCGSPDVP